jgi:hypothetical protein
MNDNCGFDDSLAKLPVTYAVNENLMEDILCTLDKVINPRVKYDKDKLKMADEIIAENQYLATKLTEKINEQFNL